MKVCIGITTKNRGAILEKAIRSALNQDYPDKLVFVFDDGSTDYTPQLKNSYPQIIWERAEESIGLMAARNRMMQTCGADLFVSLDDDAWFLHNDEVSEAVKLMQNDRAIGAISYDVLQNDTRRFKEIARSEPFETNVFIGCGHMLRLSAVEKAGYYVPFPMKYGHEEKDLCIRLIDAGYKVLFVPGLHVWHDYTPLERNVEEQQRSFIINDLVFPYRRVPKLFLIPVLGNNIFRKLYGTQFSRHLSRPAVKTFLSLIPTQKKLVKRVSVKTYRQYRSLSKNFLRYLSDNDQRVGQG